MQGFYVIKLTAIKTNNLYLSIRLAQLRKTEKRYTQYLRFGILTSMCIKAGGFWDVTSCSLVVTTIAKENSASKFYLEDGTRKLFLG
jgi:hypothetical protein